jgi:hypothetical protein
MPLFTHLFYVELEVYGNMCSKYFDELSQLSVNCYTYCKIDSLSLPVILYSHGRAA